MPTALERRLVRRFYERLGEPPIRIRLWDDSCVADPPEAMAAVRVRDRAALLKLLINPDLYFGDAYSDGSIEVEGDLVRFLETAYGVMGKGQSSWLRRRLVHWQARPRSNSLSGSRKNIHQHYDLGNDFYRLWLDEAMVYTCAYFPDPRVDLEQAQAAKMDHVARKLRLRPGESVVEAGCGWGSLALHLARHYGVRVRAYNISHEQIRYARERAEKEGLSNCVEFIEDDYRNISGRYDAFVSVGMLEHVGTRNYETLGETIHRCLEEDGRGLIHTIGRNQAMRMNAWIERRIFPGAYPPTLREMMDIFEPQNFSVLDVENLRLHYARTLEHWLARFDQHVEEVAKRFGEAFVRAWRLYLAGSIAAFNSGGLQLFQVLFAPGESNQVPWTRAHVYDTASDEESEPTARRAAS